MTLSTPQTFGGHLGRRATINTMDSVHYVELNSSTGYTPFFLLFGAEAVPPTDVHYCAPCVVAYIKEDA
jgi:hypothetical protein